MALRDQWPRLAERVERCESTLLRQVEAEQLAQAALALRYGEHWRESSPIQPSALLTPRRQDAVSDALWSVFNRLHENLFKGGLVGTVLGGRRTRTRAIQGVSECLRLNRALWSLTRAVCAEHRRGRSWLSPLTRIASAMRSAISTTTARLPR